MSEHETENFLRVYFEARGIDESQASNQVLDEVYQRADLAREQFKASLPPVKCDAISSITAANRYKRRLANNRRSAAGARVYTEVYRVEILAALKEAESRMNKLAVIANEKQRLLDEQRKLLRKHHNNTPLNVQQQHNAVNVICDSELSNGEQSSTLVTAVKEESKHTTVSSNPQITHMRRLFGDVSVDCLARSVGCGNTTPGNHNAEHFPSIASSSLMSSPSSKPCGSTPRNLAFPFFFSLPTKRKLEHALATSNYEETTTTTTTRRRKKMNTTQQQQHEKVTRSTSPVSIIELEH